MKSGASQPPVGGETPIAEEELMEQKVRRSRKAPIRAAVGCVQVPFAPGAAGTPAPTALITH